MSGGRRVPAGRTAAAFLAAAALDAAAAQAPAAAAPAAAAPAAAAPAAAAGTGTWKQVAWHRGFAVEHLAGTERYRATDLHGDLGERFAAAGPGALERLYAKVDAHLGSAA